jgi:hypothetical protein
MTTENLPADFGFHNRYRVAEKILLMRYNPQGSPDTIKKGLRVPTFLPWEQVLSTTAPPLYFKELVVTERHAVPDDWGDKIQATGFIAQSHDGARWYNQYPRASYGQVSDVQDSRWVHAMLKGRCDEVSESLMDALPSRDYGIYEDVGRRLDDIWHAVNAKGIFVIKDSDKHKAMVKHYEWLIKTIEKMAKVTIEKRVIFADHPDLISHRVIWK